MMKGVFLNFRKMAQKSSLHMKRKKRDSKIEKYFNFLKMDKKNVQKLVAKNVLTVKKKCLDNKKLSSQIKSKK